MRFQDHGHSRAEIADRIGNPVGNGVLRDAIYGAIDGTVTTFAIVAGVVGAGFSPYVIVVLGLANVLADGYSMAAANYSGAKAERDNAERIRKIEERHIKVYPDGERIEVREILGRMGLQGQVLEDATEMITRDKEAWIALMMEGEYGLGRIEPRPMTAALTTFAAFLSAGMIPLFPFLLLMENAFLLSAFATMVTFFGIGAAKSNWSLASWWRSGGETMAIGGTAAGLAYLVGSLLSVH